MSLRIGEIYLSWPTRHCLRLLAQASQQQGKTGQNSDAIADAVLSAWLQREHAELWAWVQQRQQSEQDMVTKLAAVKGKGKHERPVGRTGREAVTDAQTATDHANSAPQDT